MRIERKLRYFCDYCGKSYGNKYWAEKHEKGCTCNPERKCGLCYTAGMKQRPMCELVIIAEQSPTALKEHVLDYERNIDLQELRDFSGNCPACILAALRMSGMDNNFHFKDELAEFWSDVNESRDY
jgi:hypothetical protein